MSMVFSSSDDDDEGEHLTQKLNKIEFITSFNSETVETITKQ